MNRLASISRLSIRFNALDFALDFNVLERYLIVTSIVYLAVPHLIFGAGWLWWPWAALYVGLFAAALIEVARNTFQRQSETAPAAEDAPRFRLWQVGLILVASFLWIAPAGIGGYGPQKADWYKHEIIIKTLIEDPWPPLFTLFDSTAALTYYVAYYLPAVVVGKIAGWDAAHHTLFAWSYVGLVLAMLWFCALVRRASILVVALFGLFSGQDIIGAVLARAVDWQTPVVLNIVPGLEGWSDTFQYSSFTTLLVWVPNQGLPGWLATALILHSMLYSRRKEFVLFAFALSALWSPFVTLGLGLYIAVDFFMDSEPIGKRIRSYLTVANVCGLVALLVVALFYLSKLLEISPLINVDLAKGFLFDFYPGSNLTALAVLVTFWVVEFGLYAVLVLWGLRYEEKKWRVVYWTTVVYLLLIPLYRYGYYNDFSMRVSIPPLFIIAVLVGRTLVNRQVPRFVRGALVALLLLGAATALGEMRFHIGRIQKYHTWIEIPPVESVLHYVELYPISPHLAVNYIGAADSPFVRYIAREREGPLPVFPERMAVISFDDKILLGDYRSAVTEPVMPSEDFRIHVPLYVMVRSVEIDYEIVLRLVDEAGREWAKTQGWPQGEPTSLWSLPIERDDTRTITVPADAPPGSYRIELSVVEPETQEPLHPYVIASGERLPDHVLLGEVVVGGSASVSAAP